MRSQLREMKCVCSLTEHRNKCEFASRVLTISEYFLLRAAEATFITLTSRAVNECLRSIQSAHAHVKLGRLSVKIITDRRLLCDPVLIFADKRRWAMCNFAKDR